MNRRLFSILIAAILLLAVLTLSACQPEEEPAHVCDFKKTKTVAATCLVEGYTEYTCEGCGHVIRRDFVEPSTAKHSYAKETIKSTCTTYGYTLETCKYCGDKQYSKPTNPSHSFDEGVVVLKNCNGKSVVGYTCSGCGIYEERLVDKIDHDCESINVTVVEPTAMTSGYTLHECLCRKYSFKDNFVAPLNAENLTFEIFANYEKDGIEESSVRQKAYTNDVEVYIPYDYLGREVTELAIGAFQNATELQVIYLTRNIESIGDLAFYGASNLQKIVFEGSISEWKKIQKGTEWAPSGATASPENVNDALSNVYFYIECNDGRLYVDGSILFNEGADSERFVPAEVAAKLK